MNRRPPARIAFLGFGLIGGSIAKALGAGGPGGHESEPGSHPHLSAWTPTGHGPVQAAADGVIDEAAGSIPEAVDGADLVVIAAPAMDAIELVERLGSDLATHLTAGAVVTDVTSTKGAITEVAVRSGLRFVGGHPMAGLETSGYAAAVPALFVDRPWVIVVPDGTPTATADPVRWLATRCGAMPIEMSAAEHDAATAAVSHLPLVAAAALVEAVHGGGGEAWAIARSLASSGWASATRLALGDPRMGAGILATNRADVAAGVRALRAALDAWLTELERPDGPDAAALERRFAAVRAILESGMDDAR
ncbi:MAG: prephenate dehydrogenase/arogenate dehydrogenase family protein [Chloroflexota bacterium]